MHRLTRHLRGLLVAAAAVVLSGGAALAARPTDVDAPPAAADPGLSRASEVSGKTLPARPEAPEAPALPIADEEGEADEAALEPDQEGEPAADGERPQNHGWFVSEAAKTDTPAGFDNHGEYVSEVARGDDGKPEGATAAGERGSAGAEAAKAAKANAAKPGKPEKAGRN